jgi:hypothetical protein
MSLRGSCYCVRNAKALNRLYRKAKANTRAKKIRALQRALTDAVVIGGDELVSLELEYSFVHRG